jgi:hypothetical protein
MNTYYIVLPNTVTSGGNINKPNKTNKRKKTIKNKKNRSNRTK